MITLTKENFTDIRTGKSHFYYYYLKNSYEEEEEKERKFTEF